MLLKRVIYNLWSVNCSRRLLSVDLSYTVYGGSEHQAKTPLLITHGLFGHKGNWHSLCKAIHKKLQCQVYAVDLRNHGDSAQSTEMTYDVMANDIYYFVEQEVLPNTYAENIHLLGHSMGGKAASVVAFNHPTIIKSLIIEDVTPKGYQTNSENAIALHGYIQGMLEIEKRLSEFDLVIEARQFASKHLSQYVKDAAVKNFLLMNLAIDADGKIKWRFNLSTLRDTVDDIIGFTDKYEKAGATFTGPTLVISGSESNYVTENDHDLLKRYFPKVEFVQIANAGHWVHSEKPSDFMSVLIDFIKKN